MIQGNIKFNSKYNRFDITVRDDNKVLYRGSYKQAQTALNIMSNKITHYNEIEDLKRIDHFRCKAYLSQSRSGIYG